MREVEGRDGGQGVDRGDPAAADGSAGRVRVRQQPGTRPGQGVGDDHPHRQLRRRQGCGPPSEPGSGRGRIRWPGRTPASAQSDRLRSSRSGRALRCPPAGPHGGRRRRPASPAAAPAPSATTDRRCHRASVPPCGGVGPSRPPRWRSRPPPGADRSDPRACWRPSTAAQRPPSVRPGRRPTSGNPGLHR